MYKMKFPFLLTQSTNSLSDNRLKDRLLTIKTVQLLYLTAFTMTCLVSKAKSCS